MHLAEITGLQCICSCGCLKYQDVYLASKVCKWCGRQC